MTLISFVEISRSFGGTHIFGPATGLVRRGDRIGVVGPNGAGKTTFCRVLAGLDSPDQGRVHRGKNLRLHYMEQEPVLESGRAVIEELVASAEEIQELQKRLNEFSARLDSGENPGRDEMEGYGAQLDRFDRLEGYSLNSRAEKVLTGLGLGQDTFSRPVSTLSGGQKSRLALAKALLAEPDLLFLDEPTNHLDLRAIEFLENYLLQSSSTCLVISHDRAFLDNIASRTIEVLDGHVTLRGGNYSAYSVWAEAEAEKAERELKNYERKVENIEDFIRRNIYGQKTRQAQSRRKMLARLKPPPRARRQRKTPNWEIGVARESASLVFEARGLSKAWPGHPPLFENLNLTLLRGETLAVIGDNGTGKSTLLEVLAGGLVPDSGRITWGGEVQTVRLPQHILRPKDERKVLEYMAGQAPELTLGELRSLLARFLFSGERVEQSVDSLSEGEFRRLILCGLIHSRANLLLLDEPTNHLDIYSREALQNALVEYPGTVVLISHDRGLLSALATRVLEFNDTRRAEPRLAKVVVYEGDFTYYKLERERLERALSAKAQTIDPPAPPRPEAVREKPAERKSGLSKNELRKLKERKIALENLISELEERRAGLQLELADPQTYKQAGRATESVAGLEALTGQIDQAYREWEELIEYE